METVELSFDFYNLFDRMGDGVKYCYKVEFDKVDIMQNNVNSTNFKVLPNGRMLEGDKRYLQKYHIKTEDWCADAHQSLTANNNGLAVEAFFDEKELDWFPQYFAKFHP